MNGRQARLPCLAPGNVSPDEGITRVEFNPIIRFVDTIGERVVICNGREDIGLGIRHGIIIIESYDLRLPARGKEIIDFPYRRIGSGVSQYKMEYLMKQGSSSGCEG